MARNDDDDNSNTNNVRCDRDDEIQEGTSNDGS